MDHIIKRTSAAQVISGMMQRIDFVKWSMTDLEE
jgi:hypothetical protein